MEYNPWCVCTRFSELGTGIVTKGGSAVAAAVATAAATTVDATELGAGPETVIVHFTHDPEIVKLGL